MSYQDFNYKCGCKKSHPKNYGLSPKHDSTICFVCGESAYISPKGTAKWTGMLLAQSGDFGWLDGSYYKNRDSMKNKTEEFREIQFKKELEQFKKSLKKNRKRGKYVLFL